MAGAGDGSAKGVAYRSRVSNIESPQRPQHVLPRRPHHPFDDRIAEPGQVDSYRAKPSFGEPHEVLLPHRAISYPALISTTPLPTPFVIGQQGRP
jgi:hypothetical protein